MTRKLRLSIFLVSLHFFKREREVGHISLGVPSHAG